MIYHYHRIPYPLNKNAQKNKKREGGGDGGGRDRMTVGFTTTYVISAYRH